MAHSLLLIKLQPIYADQMKEAASPPGDGLALVPGLL